MNGGLLLIDKARGMTSREVDNLVGKRFNTHKVGHLGTLDPFATGLLIVAVNKGTKYLPYLEDGEKTYVATLKLGTKTLTGDDTSEAKEEIPVPALTEGTIKNALNSFLGESLQVPPMTSAKKVNGEALYKKAHKGIEIEREPIKIEVYEAELLEFDQNNQSITFSVRVSKGTYIRTLGEDLACKLGTVGHLTSLRRIKIGNFSVSEAETLENAEFKKPIDFLSNFTKISVSSEMVKSIMDGRPINLNSEEKEVLLTYQDEPLAIYEKREKVQYVSKRGLF